ncbi:Rab3 GTPase-activating protein catalytic subunit-domain-containing protein [Chlamydoabsidia padenii]|nr:Rab3 GTPase-activating protein catalytic subunit-domain-containing protein [Chlamydoabsidia padenii]
MTSNRRQSAGHGEELFEFVDYTSVSNFERLVTSIEEVLLSWGVKDNSYGVFSDDMLTMVPNKLPTSSTPFEYSRQESVSVGTETYKLTYHCHPHAALDSTSSTLPLLLDNFYQYEAPLSSVETSRMFHPIHRWTGLGRFFTLAPVSDSIKSKLFASSKVNVDIHQAKLLLSAGAIAFSNVHCLVPVFISVGQARYSSYTGYMLQHDGKMDLEVRFNSSVISSPPPHCHMSGLQEVFIRNLNANRFDNGLPPLASTEKRNILKGAVFTYNLKNWFNENWKQWDEDDDEECDNGIGNSDENQDRDQLIAKARTSFTGHILRTTDWNDTLSDTLTLPTLPFGPYNDPLRTMTLNAIFPLGSDTANRYIDDAVHSNMDALTADFWELTCEFAPSSQQRAFLSTLIDKAISSWVKDPSNRDYLAPFDSNNNINNTMGDDSPTDNGTTGLVRNILHAMSNNNRNGGSMVHGGNQIAVVKSDQVETIMNALFNKSSSSHLEDSDMLADNNNDNSTSSDFIKVRNANSDLSVYTSCALGLRLKHGASVPWKSFLWNLVVYQLDALQDMNKGGGYGTAAGLTSSSSSSSYMGFLRVLWIEIVRQIRWHWENLIPIPNVDPYLYRQSTTSKSKQGSQQYGCTIGIDLSYNILHQKLAMINCCIHQSNKQSPKDDNHSTSNRKNISSLFDDMHDARATTTDKSRTDKYNDQLGLSADLDSPVSINDDDGDDKAMRCDTNSDISEGELFFDSVDNLDKTIVIDAPIDSHLQAEDTTMNQDIHDNHQHLVRPSSYTSSISDVSELAHSASMQESFVGLNYSTSAESDPCQHVPSNFGDIDDWSNGINRAAEIQDPNAFEGRSHQHESIMLLKTNAPLWIPVTQNPGFMTEDMIQQQADVFESLGTSDNATQIRAKLQSAQLYSDMQAFKAANPYAVLEDFVRWHSPKDWIDKSNDSSSHGCLSARMSEPTNIWQELWKCSRRIPASRQRSLFNLNSEGEKALHYLESLSIHDVFAL